MAEVFELRPHFEWRGLGFISQSGLKLSDACRSSMPSAASACLGCVRRSQGVSVQVLKGVIKPWECKVWDRLHPGAADRHLHGVLGGRLCRVLQLRALRP